MVRLSDVASQRRLRGLELWDHVFEPLGVRHQLNVPLYESGRRLVGLGLNRGGRDFSDGELAVMELLRVELAQIVSARETPSRETLSREALESAGLSGRVRCRSTWSRSIASSACR